MSQRAVDALFQALFLLTDIRSLFRKTAPDHDFDEAERQKAEKTIEKLKKQVSILEQEILK
ncbi:hypothetical protein [Methanoplanus limicola]|uniref:Uncharacterized protein n=1 Tax=Methanoplanus limicola DSM 2279 TaxID=937775 RepID=H1Z291_9EURY|nr:hypothetical protein [Methanoplanus limicola]EHQ34620.1 hypothetical protein Metlim_0482 [Methanoplanus limicola DSM 2279]